MLPVQAGYSYSKKWKKTMLISVIIPAYNCRDTICKTLDSVYAQTVSILEVIVINDGSKDDTFDVITNYKKSKNLDNLKILTQENSGVANARNAGLAFCKGDVICFLDSDDTWHATKLKQQLKVLSDNPELQLCGSLYTDNTISFQENLKLADQVYNITFDMQLYRNYFQPSTVVFRREVYDELGGFKTGMTHAEEGLFFLKILKHYPCALINECQINYGDGKSGFGESGLSADLWEMEKGELSNYLEIYKLGYISAPKLLLLLPFSFAKFIRRFFISKVLN
jgi:glycosyltransferase involved in cell wall biosynthesis